MKDRRHERYLKISIDIKSPQACRHSEKGSAGYSSSQISQRNVRILRSERHRHNPSGWNDRQCYPNANDEQKPLSCCTSRVLAKYLLAVHTLSAPILRSPKTISRACADTVANARTGRTTQSHDYQTSQQSHSCPNRGAYKDEHDSVQVDDERKSGYLPHSVRLHRISQDGRDLSHLHELDAFAGLHRDQLHGGAGLLGLCLEHLDDRLIELLRQQYQFDGSIP